MLVSAVALVSADIVLLNFADSVVVRIYPSVTGQRQTLAIEQSTHF